MKELLQLVEVDPEDKVLCCAPGCGHSVYKKVHIVRDDGKIIVLGQTCFHRLYSDKHIGKSNYVSGSPKRLTKEERKLLIEKTEELISKFEKEYEERQSAHRIISIPEPPPCKSPARPVKVEAVRSKTYTRGKTRSVTCLYCGCSMLTDMTFVPAKGFKCQKCKDAAASEPLHKSRRSKYRRYT